MLTCSDPTVFEEWEKAEIEDPSPRKVDGDRIVYKSREFDLKKDARGVGRCIISDMGTAYIGKQHEGFIQPAVYRAPDVMLCMPWNSAADIWNVGGLVSFKPSYRCCASFCFTLMANWLICLLL